MVLISLLELIVIALIGLGALGLLSRFGWKLVGPAVGIAMVLALSVVGWFAVREADVQRAQQEVAVAQAMAEAEYQRAVAEQKSRINIPNQSEPPEVPEPERVTDAFPQPAETSTIPSETKPLSIIEQVYYDSGKLTSQKSLDELPDWIDGANADTQNGRTRRFLHSERFATLEEAESQLERRLQREVIDDLRPEFPAMQDWTPSLSQLRTAGIIRKAAIVTWPLKLGDFTEKVYQVHWQAELTDESRSALYAAWKPEAINLRLAYLAIGGGGLTAAMGLAALVLGRRLKLSEDSD